jgi:hypothetical protein
LFTKPPNQGARDISKAADGVNRGAIVLSRLWIPGRAKESVDLGRIVQ